MNDRNYEAVKRAVSGPFWEEKYASLFHPKFTIEFPSAPPGMPQYMDEYDTKLFFEWMRRTVKDWDVQLEELFGTPDPNLFFAVGFYNGNVCWGQRDGEFHSKVIQKIIVEDKKIRKIKMMMDPLSFIKAAGREVPIFRMDLDSPKIDNYLADHLDEEPVDEVLDTSAEAVAQRIKSNLDAFVGKGESCFAPGHKGLVWFLPPEMPSSFPPEKMARVNAWTALSCPNTVYDPNGCFYPTNDKLVYFAEVGLTTPSHWVGNNCDGMYRNRYFYILRFDELGRIKVMEEYLNPVNKFNSINVSLPTFPYFL